MGDNDTLLFGETPYAAALEEVYAKIYCSNCFEPASTRCSFCEHAVYCDEECATSDWPLHQFECPLSSAGPISVDVRLIARVAARQKIDGGVASLSTNFPTNIKSRAVNDLMSHYRDIKKDKRKQWRLYQFWEYWELFFNGTELGSMKKSHVLRLFGKMSTNAFGIFKTMKPEPDGSNCCPVIGVGLFLNASRFNHSCSADLLAAFDGKRMVLIKKNREPLPLDKNGLVKKKHFDRLTVNYGVNTDSYGAQVPLSSQRVSSLKARYYFKCRCVKCADRKNRLLEEHAANAECEKCQRPYAWIGKSLKLRPTCSCKGNRKKLDLAEKSVLVKELDAMWEDVMKKMEWETIDRSIEVCEPVWRMASKVWHRTNLRFGHLSDRLFRAYTIRAVKDFQDLSESEHLDMIKKGVRTGYALIASYADRVHDQCQVGIYLCQLAIFYEIVAGKENQDEAYHLYTKAIRIFRDNKDEAHENDALIWRAQLRSGDPMVPANSLKVNVLDGMDL